MLTLDSTIQRNPHTAFRSLEAEGLIMDPETSSLHSINEVGCVIWEFISEPRKVGDVVEKVLQEFECDRETATQDTLDFVQTLTEQGLLENTPKS